MFSEFKFSSSSPVPQHSIPETPKNRFLSDPGPIIVYSCHSLTDWLTTLLKLDVSSLLKIERIDPCWPGSTILPWCICWEICKICRTCQNLFLFIVNLKLRVGRNIEAESLMLLRLNFGPNIWGWDLVLQKNSTMNELSCCKSTRLSWATWR